MASRCSYRLLTSAAVAASRVAPEPYVGASLIRCVRDPNKGPSWRPVAAVFVQVYAWFLLPLTVCLQRHPERAASFAQYSPNSAVAASHQSRRRGTRRNHPTRPHRPTFTPFPLTAPSATT